MNSIENELELLRLRNGLISAIDWVRELHSDYDSLLKKLGEVDDRLKVDSDTARLLAVIDAYYG